MTSKKDRAAKATDVVREFVEALESGDLESAAEHMADDFVYVGPVPMPLGKTRFLDLQRGILAAFPDWSHNLGEMQEEGGVIRVTAEFTGTHTGDLVLPIPDLPVIPATGRAVSLPAETQLYTVRGGKVAGLFVLLVPGGGFQGMYRQLGARLPLSSGFKG